MHDIDRALFEGQDEGGTWGEASDAQSGFTRETESYELETDESELYEDREGAEEVWGESASYGNQELALASELLSLTNEEELDQFLGGLLKGAVSAARSFAGSAAGKAVGNILKSSARKVLPQIGQAVGNYLVPGAGGQAGKQAGAWLGSKFETGLQLEGLSPEDRELETARAFVRFATSTAQRAAATPTSVPAGTAAKQAAIAAAKQHLPGLLRPANSPAASSGNGRWVRRGRNIVILGAF